ncbi:CHAD domain-containing protein [Undibacterium sp. Di26W]|uniref:CHAD domain-containing protein n=1 Tax=Undibacterium sp. Di26W TaxID=3413035 RepID=UPI003BF348F0
MLSQLKQSMRVKLHQVKLRRSMKIEQAAQIIIAHCVAQIQDSQSAVTESDDPECIHRMHIGLRHLQSALTLFNEFMFLPEKLQAELGSLSSKLGTAHDWRLLSDSCLTAIKATAEEPQILALRQIALQMAQEREKIAYAAIRSSRYKRLLSGLSSRIEAPHAPASNYRAHKKKKPCEKLRHFIQKNLRRQQLHLLKRGDKLFGKRSEHSPKESHQFRIEVKHARDSCLFFRRFFSKQDMDDYLASLSVLQDRLGMINDAVVAGRLLGELGQERGEQVASCSFVRGYLFLQLRQLQRKLAPLWKRFHGVNFPRLK